MKVPKMTISNQQYFDQEETILAIVSVERVMKRCNLRQNTSFSCHIFFVPGGDNSACQSVSTYHERPIATDQWQDHTVTSLYMKWLFIKLFLCFTGFLAFTAHVICASFNQHQSFDMFWAQKALQIRFESCIASSSIIRSLKILIPPCNLWKAISSTNDQNCNKLLSSLFKYDCSLLLHSGL